MHTRLRMAGMTEGICQFNAGPHKAVSQEKFLFVFDKREG